MSPIPTPAITAATCTLRLSLELDPGETTLDLTRREADIALRTVRPVRGDLVVTRLRDVTWVVAADQIDEFVVDLGARLVAGPAIALAQTKALLNEGADRTLKDALADEARTQAVNFATADTRDRRHRGGVCGVRREALADIHGSVGGAQKGAEQCVRR